MWVCSIDGTFSPRLGVVEGLRLRAKCVCVVFRALRLENWALRLEMP